ncbi:MAG: hypothetical protein MPL62_00135 [Alphaproteobacteria bacterium]|nr:hypothetical protein [Alphaproteobacteria bacterium]
MDNKKAPPACFARNIKTCRSAIFGISGSLTKTFTIAAQASDASRWVRASPQKKIKKSEFS